MSPLALLSTLGARVVLGARIALLGLPVLLVAGVLGAVAAANEVPETGVGQVEIAITANDLKPSECANLDLKEVVIWRNGMGRDRDASLILGTPDADDISGGKGADCILGGAGDDAIDGNQGADVCIGGPGTDTFRSCKVVIQ
jgi:Ca2+-binding RTX toxin-like protein